MCGRVCAFVGRFCVCVAVLLAASASVWPCLLPLLRLCGRAVVLAFCVCACGHLRVYGHSKNPQPVKPYSNVTRMAFYAAVRYFVVRRRVLVVRHRCAPLPGWPPLPAQVSVLPRVRHSKKATPRSPVSVTGNRRHRAFVPLHAPRASSRFLRSCALCALTLFALLTLSFVCPFACWSPHPAPVFVCIDPTALPLAWAPSAFFGGGHLDAGC